MGSHLSLMFVERGIPACPVKFPEPPFVWRLVYISKEIHLAAVEDHKDRSEEAVWLCARPHINSGRHDS